MKSTHTLRYLPDLVRYLRQERPLALLAAEPRLNCEAVWARRLAQVPTRLAVSEHLHLSRSKFGSARWRKPYLPRLLRRTYMAADAIIAVSDGVADDLAASTGIPRTHITTIYNPVVTPQLQTKTLEPLDHPWFVPGAPPVLLSVGRLSRQKDFSTLLRAFARLRMTYAEQNVRLLVLGEGPQRRQLEALIRQLGLGASVDLPGFVDNPFAYMARAAGFVLSSAYEGLPTVLIEALACGCPVVSTDCPSGPAEILRNGQDGQLVPVGNEAALAEALHRLLAVPHARHAPTARARLHSHIARFSAQNAVQEYLKVFFNPKENNSAQGNTWGQAGGEH
jgi:glycosyltransferase involved in cell wall biosynthesis